MKPRTKAQIEVFAISNSMPNITMKQRWWAFENCMMHVGYRTKKGVDCLDCGHHFKGSQTEELQECPCCGTTLKVQTTRKKRLFGVKKYMAILDLKDEYQIVRIFQCWGEYRVGQPADFTIWEIIQQYHSTDGKTNIVARWKPFSYNDDAWGGDLEVRNNNDWARKYDIWPDRIYPEYKVRSQYIRNGFEGDISRICASPLRVFQRIESDNKAETLIKIGQHEWLAWYIGRENNRIYKYWNTLKICFRNKYHVSEDKVITYLDYLDLLVYFGKDMRSPVYACPSDLDLAHNRLVAKKEAIMRREENERAQRKIEADLKQLAFDAAKYVENRKRFFGLTFTQANLTIQVLKSVEEFKQESAIHKHCLYVNQYYNKAKSLCFAAIIDGVHMETIEVSLDEFKVLQSRGAHNGHSKHHDAIVNFMQENMHKIRECAKPQKVKKSPLQAVAA